MGTITIGPTTAGVTQKFDIAWIGPTTALNATNFPWYVEATCAGVYAKSPNRQGYAFTKPGAPIPGVSQFVKAADGSPAFVYELNLKGTIQFDDSLITVLGAALGTAQPAPTITSFSPPSASVGSTVTITGTNFTNVLGVSIGNVVATSFTVQSATTITAPVPAGVQQGAVQVLTKGGVATSTGQFAPDNTQPIILTPMLADYSQSAGIAEPQSDGRVRGASFRTLECDTNATTVDIQARTTGSNRGFSVYLAGKILQSFVLSGVGTQTYTVALPGNGYRRIKVVEGTADRDNEQGPILGTNVLKLTFPANTNSAFTRTLFETVAVIHGDSISNGAITATQQVQGWVPITRTDARGVIVTGYGSHTATVAFSTPELRNRSLAQTAASFAEAVNKVIYIALGTNDFSFNSASPSDVASWIGIYIDAEHARDASVKIIVQTPLVRTDTLGTGTNAGGFTIQQYRDPITALGQSRPWLLLVDGVGLLASSQIGPDGIHPTAQGHIILAAAIGPLLNAASANLGLPATIPWSRIFSADSGNKDLVSGNDVLVVNNGFGTPSVVQNAFGTKPGFRFIRDENDAFFFGVTNPSAYWLVAAVVNISSYDSSGGILVSGIPGSDDTFWSLQAESVAGKAHVQKKIVPKSVPAGSKQVVIYWIDADNLTAYLRVGGQTYVQDPGDAAGTGGLSSAASINQFKLGSYYDGAGYSTNMLLGGYAMAPGRYKEAAIIQVEAALNSYFS